jgi:outer membrane protein assembly factor BamB
VSAVRARRVLTFLIVFFCCFERLAHAAAPVHVHVPIYPLANRWSTEIGGPPVAGAAPVADDHNVYVALRSGHVAAYDLINGHERWRKTITAGHPLAVESGFLFVATDDAIHAFRAEDGALAWEAPTAVTAPLVAHGGWLVALTGGKAVGFRATDGSKAWEADIGAATLRPSIAEDRVFVSLDAGSVIALKLTDGTVLWEQRRLGGTPQAPFATAERVYVGASDRFFYCLNADNGEIEWPWRIGSELRGTAAANESLVFIVAYDNVLRAYDRKNGNQRWHSALAHRPATGPFVVGSAVLVASAATAEIWGWTSEGRSAGVIATPAEPAVPPEFIDRGAEGAFVFVVTGGLANQWQLTLLATAGDPPLQPIPSLPGMVMELVK